MKLITKLILVIIVTSIFGCKMVYFEQPQPIDGKSLNYFPKKFRGVWKSELSTLTINETSMVQTGYEKIKIPLSEIDTSKNYIRKGKSIYNFQDNHLEYKGKFEIESDTVVISKPTEPEEHCLNNNIILKKVGKYYILNIREDNGFWQVIQLEKNDEKDILMKLLNNEKLIEIIPEEKLAEMTSPSLDKESEDSRDFYYSGNLLKQDIISLIEAEAFSDTLINLSHTHQWLTPYFKDKE